MMMGSASVQPEEEEVYIYLHSTIGLKPELASLYARRLNDEGYDSVLLVDELTTDELTHPPIEIKPGHARKIELSQQERRVGRFALQLPAVRGSGGPDPRHVNSPGHWDAMISYTQRNAKARLLAEQICHTLRERGKSVWLDVKMSKLNEAAMKEAAQNSTAVIAIVTGVERAGDADGNCYFQRELCLSELRWAREAGVVIQPVVLVEDKSRIGEFLYQAPPDLRDLGTIDFIHLDSSRPRYWEVGMDEVIDSCLGQVEVESEQEQEQELEQPQHSEPEPEPDPEADAMMDGVILEDRLPGSTVYELAGTLLGSTWIKKTDYELLKITRVQEIINPALAARYGEYKSGLEQENVIYPFHGCTEAAMDAANPTSIVRTGFLKQFWKSSAGDWQRFGPGFYFGQQASKSHEYPLPEMCKLAAGEHERSMLLCKVACGTVLKTATNMDGLQGEAPAGYDSIHGDAQDSGDLNFDEIVVFKEEAVLPYAVVKYKFLKKTAMTHTAAATDNDDSSHSAVDTGNPTVSSLSSSVVPTTAANFPGSVAHLPTNAVEGIQQGVTSIVDAPFRALNDLVSMPVEGLQKEGVYGGVKGLTAGVVSAPMTLIEAGIDTTVRVVGGGTKSVGDVVGGLAAGVDLALVGKRDANDVPMPPEHRIAVLQASDCNVCIPTDGAVTVDGVTRYQVSVSSSEGSWTVERRYNAFFDLHGKLSTHLDRGCSHQLKQRLPAKSSTSLVKKLGPSQIEERRARLNHYLQMVFSNERLKAIGCSGAMIECLRNEVWWFVVPEVPPDAKNSPRDDESLTQKVAYLPGRVGTGVVDGVAGGVSATAVGATSIRSGVAGGVGSVGSGIIGGVSSFGSGVSFVGSSLGLRRSRKDCPGIPEGTPPSSHDSGAYTGAAVDDAAITLPTSVEPEPEPEVGTDEQLPVTAETAPASGEGTQPAHVNFGASADGSPVTSDQAEQAAMLGTLTVKARKTHTSSIGLKAGATLHWEFELAAKDIGLVVKFSPTHPLKPPDGSSAGDKLTNEVEIVVVPYCKHVAECGKVTGSFKSLAQGTVVFEWDNSYSKITAKTVAYRLSYS